VHITHAAFPRYLCILDGEVDAVMSYPFPVEQFARFTHVAWMENSIEGRPVVGEHPSERFARFFGFEVAPGRCAYTVTDAEREKAMAAWPRTKKPRVAVQPRTSTDCKDYPHMLRVLPLLHKAGCEILTVGAPHEWGGVEPPGCYDAMRRNTGLRDSIALVAQCDVVLSGDSVMIHVADALGIPCVGMYGPFSGEAYMAGYKGRYIQGARECSPCHWHPRGTPFPPNQPCGGKNRCLALDAIEPERVARLVLREVGL
jgi:ADP-heptose:LPS heptosyltransferase